MMVPQMKFESWCMILGAAAFVSGLTIALEKTFFVQLYMMEPPEKDDDICA